ncbi:MAG: hypothetical protein LBG95_00255 [Treponema sp.]|jgi:hypothetical protein|nr:hypothetical protein [Treponema sp.]
MKYLSICGLAVLLLGGCVSLVEKTGQVVDGSAFAEKKTAAYRADGMEINEMRSKAGERSVLITLKKFPAIKLRGSAPDETGAFFFTSLDYLGGNTHGWNEYRLDLSGSGNLVLGETSAALSVYDEIETVEITSGRIKRYDTRITGNDALSSLRNRRERILVLTEWMNGREDAPETKDAADFEKYWKPVLFPEMVKKKTRPEGWQREGDQWERAEDIRWNTSYTQRILPEILWSIRNSGTMLRDWEEALEWIYVEHEWSRITEMLTKETRLEKGKK